MQQRAPGQLCLGLHLRRLCGALQHSKHGGIRWAERQLLSHSLLARRPLFLKRAAQTAAQHPAIAAPDTH